MTRREVEDLLKDMESDRIERTISFREDKLGPAVCAFANDLPGFGKAGYLLLGVKDDGRLAGLTIGDTELQKIGDVRQNGNVLPPPQLMVSPVFHFDEGDVVVVKVDPADFPPVRYKGRVYIRVGPRKGVATEQEERRLIEKRIAHARTFDEQPCLQSSMEDLNMEYFKLRYLPTAIDVETLAANHRDSKEQLSSLGFFDLHQNCCTNAGILMFGRAPRAHLHGAYLQYIRFNSNEMDMGALRAEKEFSGALVAVLEQISDFVKVNIIEERTVAKDGFQQEKKVNYPLWALRELAMNAVMHRSYESNAPIYIYHFTDRIEIINPGSLYGEVRPENFPGASDYRNPVLATAMKNLNYVNRFNFGIFNAQKQLAKNGNPPAEFDLSLQTKFKVTIWINQNW
ncbi:ATP-binding protein [Phaeodactylibacter xiamenensis]|uniref:ATP-binding protein n=1 Tax=Phaeodactylibacter xiamenensis TaxID=1524460 RepID=UPI003BACC6D4